MNLCGSCIRMSIVERVSSRISEFPEAVIYAAYSVGGCLLFRILGPEEGEQKFPASHAPGVQRANLGKPIPGGELPQR